jgi:hypothetical protein
MAVLRPPRGRGVTERVHNCAAQREMWQETAALRDFDRAYDRSGSYPTTSLAVVCALPPGTDMVREACCANLLCLDICPCRQPHRED